MRRPFVPAPWPSRNCGSDASILRTLGHGRKHHIAGRAALANRGQRTGGRRDDRSAYPRRRQRSRCHRRRAHGNRHHQGWRRTRAQEPPPRADSNVDFLPHGAGHRECALLPRAARADTFKPWGRSRPSIRMMGCGDGQFEYTAMRRAVPHAPSGTTSRHRYRHLRWPPGRVARLRERWAPDARSCFMPRVSDRPQGPAPDHRGHSSR